MAYQIILLLIKVIVGTSLGLLGVYNNGIKKNKKKMRIFDQFEDETKHEILKSCISYAKGEISELNLPATTDIKALALMYDTMYFLNSTDFEDYIVEVIPAFVGPRPIKRPL